MHHFSICCAYEYIIFFSTQVCYTLSIIVHAIKVKEKSSNVTLVCWIPNGGLAEFDAGRMQRHISILSTAAKKKVFELV